MARLMIGQDLPHTRHGQPSRGEARLVLDRLALPNDQAFGVSLQDVSLTVHAGEVVGIAGISGNGQQELLAAISGEQVIGDAARVTLCGRPAGTLEAEARRALGRCFVPAERLGRGAVPQMSLSENGLLTAHRKGFIRSGLIRFARVRQFADRCIAEYGVKCGGPEAEARSLSGGNLQKFIVGREIMQQPKVLVIAQPTWGVDVGAAAFIRQRIIDLRNEGVAVLVLSEELDELFEICDRIAVIAQGRLSPEKAVRDTSVEEIGLWMSGMWPDAGKAGPERPAEAADALPA